MKFTKLCALLSAALFCAMFSSRALGDIFGSGANTFEIDFVGIGNPGNAPDENGLGSVPYSFRMGKFEVTAVQYTEFLNAIAKDDPNVLYDPFLAVQGHNIVRSGNSGSYSYSVDADWANRPVNFVSFWNAARFVNWLHNGQPTGQQGSGTTEDGAYHDIGNQSLFGRNSDAKFWVPNEDEWYKAAYHDKNAGLAANYFDYATGTNSVPGRDMTELTTPGNNANFLAGGYLIGEPYYRTEVGEFELSASPYGTFDQAGNLWEWNESIFVGVRRGTRGGSYNDVSSDMIGSAPSNHNDPTLENLSIGFRIATTIPEPGTLLLVAMASVWCLLRRR